MFVLCPHCQFLVTTDPVSGQPPTLCPRCAEPMRADDPSAALPPVDDADRATDATMDADGPGVPDPPVEHRVEQPPEPAAESTTPASTVPLHALPPQDDAVAGDASTTRRVGDDDATSRGQAHGAPAYETSTLDDQAVDDQAVDEQAVDEQPVDEQALNEKTSHATATESTDALIEAMVDPASIENEAALDGVSAHPEDAVADLPADTAPEASAPPGLPAADPCLGPLADAAPPGTVPAPGKPPSPAKPTPSFVRRPAAVSGVTPRRPRLKAAAIGGLALVLALQLVLADRARLASDAQWRPAMSTLCHVLHCTLPPWREPAAFTLLQRDVRPHPSIASALRVTATFRNDARWAQPLPGVLVTLSDIDGHTAAARTFMPRDYLDGAGHKTAQTQTMLASGHSTTITMDIVEPTPRIVAFTFDFE